MTEGGDQWPDASDAWRAMLDALGALFVAGAEPRWECVHRGVNATAAAQVLAPVPAQQALDDLFTDVGLAFVVEYFDPRSGAYFSDYLGGLAKRAGGDYEFWQRGEWADVARRQEAIAREARATVFHMFTSPRNNAGSFPTSGGFESDEARDEAMTGASTDDIGWVRPGRERSGTAKNLARRR